MYVMSNVIIFYFIYLKEGKKKKL